MERFLLQVALMLSSVTGIDVKSAGLNQGDGGHAGPGDIRRHQRGRAEHRRHTIANGVDFGMVREQPCRGLLPHVRALQRSLTADVSTVGLLLSLTCFAHESCRVFGCREDPAVTVTKLC